MASKTTNKETKTEKALSKTASLFGQLFLDRITDVDDAGNRSITTDKTKLGGWSKPWNVSGSRIPHNVVTGTGYKGGNAGLFSMAAGDYDHACFATFKGWNGMTETDRVNLVGPVFVGTSFMFVPRVAKVPTNHSDKFGRLVAITPGPSGPLLTSQCSVTGR